MNLLGYIKAIFKLSPLLFLINFMTIIFQAALETLAIVSLTPIIDYFLKNQANGLSDITQRFSSFLHFFKITPSLQTFVCIFIAMTTLKAVGGLFFKYISLRTKYFFLRKLMTESFQKFMNAGMPFFNSEKQGVLINTFNTEITTVGNSLVTISTFFSNIIRIIFFATIPFSISWQLTLIAGLVFSLVMLPSKLSDKLSYQGGKKNVSTGNQLNITLQESLTAIKVILAFGNKEKSIARYQESFEAHRKATIPFQMIGNVLNAIFDPIFIAILFLILYIAQTYYQIAFSEVIVMLYAFKSIIPILLSIVIDKNLIIGFIPSYEQIQSLQLKAEKMTLPNGRVKFEKLENHIELKDVSFKYGSKLILNSVSLKIKKGEKIAIVGKSGSGKTTIVDLILGLYHVNSGSIFIDKNDIKNLDINTFRQRIGYVPQDPVLFNNSLRENLLWANTSLSDVDIMKACKQSNASEFVEQLPNGLDTQMGERGTKLSGGERQRIALSRALVRTPDLLILDEATSALDSYSEKLIQESIEKIGHETTVILIAHRLSTIKKVDIIFVIDEGRVVESGNFDTLIKQNGIFTKLSSHLT